MSVLKLGLKQFGPVLVMKVLEQNDSVVNRGHFDFVSAKSGLAIRSVQRPELKPDYNSIYVRGGIRQRDNEVVYYQFNSNSVAEDWAKRIKLTVKELNAKYAKKEEPETSAVIEFEVVE